MSERTQQDRIKIARKRGTEALERASKKMASTNVSVDANSPDPTARLERYVNTELALANAWFGHATHTDPEA